MSPFGCLLYYTEAEYYSIKQYMSSIHEKREENLFVSTGSIYCCFLTTGYISMSRSD
jgi:hypothetical protein